jgi:hypothetical protein
MPIGLECWHEQWHLLGTPVPFYGQFRGHLMAWRSITPDEFTLVKALVERVLSETKAFFAERGMEYDAKTQSIRVTAMFHVVVGLLNLPDDPSERREALENFTDELYSLTVGDNALRQGWLPPKRPD